MNPFQPLERVRYFTGKLLTAEDLEQEQEYHLGRMRRRNRFLHGWGVVAGLNVSVPDDQTVIVEPGMAIDCFGNEIVIGCRQKLAIAAGTVTACVTVAYAEIGTTPVPTTRSHYENSRVQESAIIELSKSDPTALHRDMQRGSPGCGIAHPLTIARISRRKTQWRIVSSNRLR